MNEVWQMRRKWPWWTGGAVLVLFVTFVSVMYWFDPARLTTDPEYSRLSRTVSGDTLLSEHDPPVQMAFDEQFEYIGGQKFVLYGTADVEQHFFVEEHPDGTLKSFVWIQFEGFLPDNEYTYDYSGSPLRLQIGAFDFYTDTAPGASNRLLRLGWPGTDGYLARKFAADKGYAMPDDYAYARLVHIPDDMSRKELLIIFMEDLAPTGWTVEALREGGENEERWPEVEGAHLDRIKRVMSLTRPG